MRDHFARAARLVSSEEGAYRSVGMQKASTLNVGLEIELPLLHHDLTLATQNDRDAIIQFLSPPDKPKFLNVELAAHQLELFNPTPINLRREGFSGLLRDLQGRMNIVEAAAKARNTRILRTGSYPFGAIEDVDYTKGDPKYAKYQRSPSWHRFHQRSDAKSTLGSKDESLDVSNASVVGLLNSVQLTIDAEDFDDAIDKLNRSWMISPFALAIGANSCFLGLRDTGYADVRFVAWSISHDTRSHEEVELGRRTRVGLPRRYCDGLNDYFNRILSYPFLLNDQASLAAPFQAGNGLYWRDARLKFFLDQKIIGVEFRPLPLQPTLIEDLSLMAFYVGRLLWSCETQEPLLPMEDVCINKESAMKSGLSGTLRYLDDYGNITEASAKDVLEREIQRAEIGLHALIPDEQERTEWLEPARARLTKGSPAEQFLRLVREFEKGAESFDAERRRIAIETAIETMGLLK